MYIVGENSSKGLTLVEVLVAMSLLAMTSLAVVQMSQVQGNALKRSMQGFEVFDMIHTAQSVFQSRFQCDKNIYNQNPPIDIANHPSSPWTPHEVMELRYYSKIQEGVSKPVLIAQKKYGGVWLNKITITNSPETPFEGAENGKFEVHLEVYLDN